MLPTPAIPITSPFSGYTYHTTSTILTWLQTNQEKKNKQTKQNHQLKKKKPTQNFLLLFTVFKTSTLSEWEHSS